MTRQTTEALIAESREVARQYDPAFRFVLTRVIDRLEVVAKDSSTGQQMHAYWQRRAEDAEQKRDRLAAVMEKVREQVEHTMHPERYKARCGVCRLDTILATAPTDALREVRAEAWDRGWYVGYRDHSEDPLANMSDNPYRSGS